jgi:hypothetical protein
MAELKTKPTKASVDKFLKSVIPQSKREDSYKLLEMMKKITGLRPYMWGPTIVGFGTYHYKYATGHEGDAAIAGFSPRKQALVVYIAPDFEKSKDLLKKLGKHKSSVACIYIKKLDDVDTKVLKQIISESMKFIKNYKWPG